MNNLIKRLIYRNLKNKLVVVNYTSEGSSAIAGVKVATKYSISPIRIAAGNHPT